MDNFKKIYEDAKWEWIKKQHPVSCKNDPNSFERGFKPLASFPKISGAPSLERAITDYLKFIGHQCSKITTSGRYVAGKKLVGVNSVLGMTKSLDTGTYIPGGSTKGVADLLAIIYGLSFSIEIKYSKGDRQRETQKKYQSAVENAGGFYMITKSFEEFILQLNEILELPQVILMREFQKNKK